MLAEELLVERQDGLRDSGLWNHVASLFLSRDWRASLVMPLAAYFDAGGHQEDQKYLVVAGFSASVEMWVDFDRLWLERLGQDGLEYFHAVEFAHSPGQFAAGWKNDEPRRRSLCADLMDILKRHVSRKFSDVVINEALDANMTEDTKDRFHINAYSLAGRTCAARLREWMRSVGWQTAPELIFEEGDLGADLLRRSLVRDGFPEPIFRPKKNKTENGLVIHAPTPLQAADWLAYEVFLASKSGNVERWAMSEFLTTPGNGGIYTERDIERLEYVFNTPTNELLTAGFWDVHTLT